MIKIELYPSEIELLSNLLNHHIKKTKALQSNNPDLFDVLQKGINEFNGTLGKLTEGLNRI